MNDWPRHLRFAVAVAACICFSGILGATNTSHGVPHLLRVGVDQTYGEVKSALSDFPGIGRETSRDYKDGTIERRFVLKDGTFIRVVTQPDRTSLKFLSWSFSKIFGAKQILSDIELQAGAPSWQAGSAGSGFRAIWGGTAAPELAIIPKRGVFVVIEMSADASSPVAVSEAVPSWYVSAGRR